MMLSPLERRKLCRPTYLIYPDLPTVHDDNDDNHNNDNDDDDDNDDDRDIL
jgi:hypothetical protein